MIPAKKMCQIVRVQIAKDTYIYCDFRPLPYTNRVLRGAHLKCCFWIGGIAYVSEHREFLKTHEFSKTYAHFDHPRLKRRIMPVSKKILLYIYICNAVIHLFPHLIPIDYPTPTLNAHSFPIKFA